MNSPDLDIRQRIKASELLAKAAGIFGTEQPDSLLYPVVFTGEDVNE